MGLYIVCLIDGFDLVGQVGESFKEVGARTRAWWKEQNLIFDLL